MTEVNNPRRVLALFDLDKTIIDTSASMAYRRPMAERGMLSKREVLRMLALLGSYMLTTHTDENLEATKQALTKMIAGRDATALRSIATDALQEVIIPYVYDEARVFLEEHRKLGHDIAIVTASARVLVAPIAEEFGADHLLATELEEIDGKFTGKVLHFNKGQGKVDKVNELVNREGYDLTRSYAYSDSHTDLPLLEMVGHPYAVNPDRQLRKIAMSRNWPIETFAKPEPFLESGAMIAGASTLAALGALATGITMWLKRGEEGA